MSWGMVLFDLDLVVLGAISAALLWIKKYQEGIVGHVGLGGTIFMAVLILGEQLGGIVYRIDRELILLVTCLTLFVIHHFYRYLRHYHFKPACTNTCGAAVMHKEG